MRQIKIGNKEKSYLEFKKEEDDDIMVEAVDDSGHVSKFTISNEELEVLYRYMIGESNYDRSN